MIKLKQIGSNQTELHFDNVQHGLPTIVLFSYDTPVAAHVAGVGNVRTTTKYSSTTTKHINRWLGKTTARPVSQKAIDSLLGKPYLG